MAYELPCEIVRDLLPSYADALTSELSGEAVAAHLAACPDCARLYAQMKAPEPEQEAEAGDIDYLKELRRRTRRTVTAVVCLCLAAAAALIVYFATRPAPEIPPQASYDARTQIVTVIGHGDYSALELPGEVERAYQIRVQDDSFDLTLNLHLFEGAENKAELEKAFIRSVAESLAFYREWLPENAPGVFDEERMNSHVSLELSAPRNLLYEYDAEGSEIYRADVPAYSHWAAAWLLSLMDEEHYGWQQVALAYYTDFLVNPHNWLVAQGELLGGWSLADNRDAFDEAAGKAAVIGLGDWGTPFESRAMSELFPALRGAQADHMSCSMAISFLAYLADSRSYDMLARWAQGELGAEEAMGRSYEHAYVAWVTEAVEKSGVLRSEDEPAT